MSQVLKAEITKLIKTAASDLGFQKRKGLYFSKSTCPGIIQLIAFGFGYDDGLFVDPSAGLVYEPIETLLVELALLAPDPYRVTVGTYLGHLPPLRNEVLWYRVAPGQTPQQMVEEMMDAIQSIAVPWLNAHQTIDSFIEDLEAGEGTILESARLRLPIAYYLTHQFDKARAFLMATIEARRVKPPQLIIADYGAFTDRLLAKIDEASSGRAG